MDQSFFQTMLAVLCANVITLLGCYSIAKINRTEAETGQPSVKYVLMLLLCAALTGAVVLLSRN